MGGNTRGDTSVDDFFGTSDDEREAGAAPALLGGSRAQAARTVVETDVALDSASGPFVDYDDPERAIEVLHREFSTRLFAYAMSMLRNREDAEDAVQTTFMNAYNSLVDGRVPRQETSW